MRSFDMRTQNRAMALALLSFLSLAATVSPTPLAAQAGGGPPLFLALPDDYPDVDGRVTLLREPGREIVVLSDAATPEDLGVAVRLLARFRRERGQPERGHGHMIPIVGIVTPHLNHARRSRLEEALVELRNRPVTNVGNLGRGRWMRWDPR
jgi:hypothetical protein